MTNQNKNSGRGSNLTQEDRIKGGEHSHKNAPNKKSNLTQDDKKKGGKSSQR